MDSVQINFNFIKKIEEDYNNRIKMLSEFPAAFRQSVEFLGDFYHQAGISLGNPIKPYTMKLINYLEMLLETDVEENIELFTMQFLKNGNGIRTHLPSDFSRIMKQVLRLFIENTNLTKNSKLWLALAINITQNNFKLLIPFELQKFYVENLGEKAHKLFVRLHMERTIEFLRKTKNPKESEVKVKSSDGTKSPRPILGRGYYLENSQNQ